MEHDLRQVIADIESCRQLDRLSQVLTGGRDKALAPAGVELNPDAPVEEMLTDRIGNHQREAARSRE